MSNRTLLAHEDHLDTHMGGAILGDRVVFRGKDLHAELGDRSWMELFVYGITGRFYDPKTIRLLNYIWVSTSYPDPRIWCNRIAALGGSARTTAGLAVGAATTACEATIYGHRSSVGVMDMLQRALRAVRGGGTVEDFLVNELGRHRRLFGYGRPLTSIDERVPHILAFLRAERVPLGDHLRLAFEIEDYLIEHKSIRMNIAAVYAGIGADIGFSTMEYHQFIAQVHLGGMPPCFVEAREHPEGSFLPIRCDRVTYHGPDRRPWTGT